MALMMILNSDVLRTAPVDSHLLPLYLHFREYSLSMIIQAVMHIQVDSIS